MKHKLIALGLVGVAFTAVFAAQLSKEKPIENVGAFNQDDNEKVKDSDEGKRRVLRPKFTVSSSKEAYDPSERIILKLTLSLPKHFRPSDEEERDKEEIEHRTPAQVTVETFEADTISVVSARRNGEAIKPTLGTVRYLDNPVMHEVRSLTTIGPGDHAAIPFIIPGLPNQGSRLITVRLNPESEHLALIYSLAEPGWYTLQFRYLYTGPDGGKPNVFRGELRSNPASFLVREADKAQQRGTGDGLVCDPLDPEFADTECTNVINEVRSMPTGATMIDTLEASPKTNVIMRTDGPSQTYATSLDDGYAEGQTVTDHAGNVIGQGTGHGSDAIIEINPADQESASMDLGSDFVHEGAHALSFNNGLASAEKAPGAKKVDLDEIIATQEQNIYLKEKGSDPVKQYCAGNQDGTEECVDVPASPTPSPGKSPAQ
jgi:Effector protein